MSRIVSLQRKSVFAEITAFSDRYGEFEKLDTEVIGVSTDSVVIILYYALMKWISISYSC